MLLKLVIYFENTSTGNDEATVPVLYPVVEVELYPYLFKLKCEYEGQVCRVL